MTDRVSTNPGRMLITPEDGSAPFYATLSMADNPTVEGTPLNKASLLTDETAALFGLGTDAVPDDVLSKLGSASTFGVYGSKSLSHDGKTVEVNLGFKPSIVIIRGTGTFEGDFGPTGYEEYFVDNPERISRSIPIILIPGLSSSHTNYVITDTGFSYSDQSIPFDTANGTKLFYFAIP